MLAARSRLELTLHELAMDGSDRVLGCVQDLTLGWARQPQFEAKYHGLVGEGDEAFGLGLRVMNVLCRAAPCSIVI